VEPIISRPKAFSHAISECMCVGPVNKAEKEKH